MSFLVLNNPHYYNLILTISENPKCNEMRDQGQPIKPECVNAALNYFLLPHSSINKLSWHEEQEEDEMIIHLWKTSRRTCRSLARQRTEEASHQHQNHQVEEVLLVVLSTSIRRKTENGKQTYEQTIIGIMHSK